MDTTKQVQELEGKVLMLEHPKSGDNIFYKVKNDSSIILIDSFGNESKSSKTCMLKKNKRKSVDCISQFTDFY